MEIYEKSLGDINGELLVDTGSGPTLYQVMSGCEVFNKVILTDFLEANRQELRRWVQDEGSSSLDWTPYLQHVCKLEGRGPSAWTEKAAKLRKAITDILPIDVLLPQPIAPGAIPSAGADCLVTSYCLEAACPDVATYKKALSNIGTLLQPGGHLLLLGDLWESFYYASPEEKLPVLTLNEPPGSLHSASRGEGVER
ncbi:phenylethanolamine N-methyltransferase-like [Mastacembelus armatus]|uniref:phenylethanolamine N-methyltransferase-like n=1 Tax=Mastacembelus armatus TaxID=205130 RepID=UPI000E4550FA|nr:phenylethanolamine N-methyltransferase-like [Mastacembelus armatus]